MLLINREINLILVWSADYVISSANEESQLAIADTEHTGDDYKCGCLPDYPYFKQNL